MAFKKSTVNAAKIPSTQTNFPSYVDLSRMGITTLAQAQSLRTYADEAKLVEQPREIVSATEGHVKIASLTSTSDLYGDYDGIRSDYATTATYGAEAVWADYLLVSHNGGGDDSTSGSNNGVAYGGVVSGDSVGKIGDATDYNGSGDYFRVNSIPLNINGRISVSAWINNDETPSGQQYPWESGSTSDSIAFTISARRNSSNMDMYTIRNNGSVYGITGQSGVSTSNWHQINQIIDTSDSMSMYIDGAFKSSTSIAGITLRLNEYINIGADRANGRKWNGLIDEFRVSEVEFSADRIETEYNNQSSENTFWGEWADVGGGTPEPDYTLTAETGTFALSGKATDFFTQYAIATTPGAFTLLGQEASIPAARLLTASTSSFTVDGSDAGLFRQYAVSAAPGAFAVAGAAANVLANYLLTGTTADFALTGDQVGLFRQLRLPCTVGEFTLSGNTANFYRQLRLACLSGAFDVAGTATPLLASYLLEAETGAYALEGQNAPLSVRYKVTAQTAGFTLSGPAAAILARYRQPLQQGVFTVEGEDVTIEVVAYIQPFCPMDSPFEDANSPFGPSESPFGPFAEGDC